MRIKRSTHIELDEIMFTTFLRQAVLGASSVLEISTKIAMGHSLSMMVKIIVLAFSVATVFIL